MSALIKLPSKLELNNLFEYDGKNLIWKTDRGNNKVKGQVAGCDTNGYRIVKLDCQGIKAHRIIWKMHYGTEPKGIDHINHQGTDNRLENLRIADQKINNRNASKRVDNSSGFTGVVRRKKRWAAIIFIEGKHNFLGSFKELEEAISMRLTANDHYGYHDNHGAVKC
jgi:hypothetical protein